MSLFSLETERPANTKFISYVKFGPTFGKKKFNQFLKVFEKEMGFALDGAVYSRVILEESTIDGQPYYELSLNENIFLPIAGRQLPILERKAKDQDISMDNFTVSFNFILNDSRNYL